MQRVGSTMLWLLSSRRWKPLVVDMNAEDRAGPVSLDKGLDLESSLWLSLASIARRVLLPQSQIRDRFLY